MAPNVTVSFWNAADINGTPLLTITDEDDFFRGLKLKPDLYGLGGWELTLARRVGFQIFDSGAFQAEAFVRFMVHAWSDTDWYFGGPLQKRNQVVVHREEDGEEIFTIGGPGPKQYLDRYRLPITEDDLGSGFVNQSNGVWVWTEASTAGRILNRVVANDAAAADPALPDLTKSFTANDDSDGNAWVEEVAGTDGVYQVPIGTSLLQLIWDLEDLGALYTTVNLGTLATPLYELEAWQAYGEDVTGTAPGAGVCILREGLNIANDALEVKGVGLRKFSHVIIEGRDGAWATAVRSSWAPGDYVKWGKIEYARTANVNLLERAGLRFLRRQDNGDQEIDVEIVPGAAPDDGYYFPAPDGVLWLGNTITLDSSADGTTHTPLDYSNEDQLVTGFEIELGPAGDTSTADKMAKSWDVTVILNRERGGQAQSPDQSSAARIGVPDTGIQLCDALTPGTESLFRFYPSQDDAGLNPAVHSGWDHDGSGVADSLKTTADGTYGSTGTGIAPVGGVSSAGGENNLVWRGINNADIGAALADALATGGATIRGQFAVRARYGIGISEAGQNMISNLSLRVLQGASTTVRGTAIAPHTLASSAGSVKWPAQSTHINRQFPAAAASAVLTAVPGTVSTDRILLEVGPRNFSTVITGYAFRPTSDAGSLDMPEDDTTPRGPNSWIEIRAVTDPTGSGLNPDLVGGDARAARCDHRHHVVSNRAPTVTDDITQGYPTTTQWTNTDTLITYLLVDEDTGEWIILSEPQSTESTPPTAAEVQAVGRWEPVTNGVDTFVWDGDEIVVTFVETSEE